MAESVYRYRFQPAISMQDVEATLLLAIWGVESLHGESQVRVNQAHYLDPEHHTCIVDARTTIGRDLNHLFLGYLRKEFGELAFHVEPVEPTRRSASDR
ncbi:MAG: hypothetical protein R3B84_13495 [Zavarzinella sp.]